MGLVLGGGCDRPGAGGRVHLAHRLGMAWFENRRVKNVREDARLLADLLRMGSLPESWIPPESVRYQRELVRYRRKLSQLRAALKTQVHAVLGKEGLVPPMGHVWGPGGCAWLDGTGMADAYETRVRSLRRIIKLYDTEITKLDAHLGRLGVEGGAFGLAVMVSAMQLSWPPILAPAGESVPVAWNPRSS